MSNFDFSRIPPPRTDADALKALRKVTRLAIAGWAAGAMVSAGLLGLTVWAVIRLVVHFTS